MPLLLDPSSLLVLKPNTGIFATIGLGKHQRLTPEDQAILRNSTTDQRFGDRPRARTKFDHGAGNGLDQDLGDLGHRELPARSATLATKRVQSSYPLFSSCSAPESCLIDHIRRTQNYYRSL